jgi:hypothetical protein
LCLTLLPAVSQLLAAEESALYRVNAGGPSLGGTPAWSGDAAGSPSPYVNAAQIGNTTAFTSNAINMTHPSVPAGTPGQLFQTERWDGAGSPEMQWNFPVTPGALEVRLYFAETYSGTQAVGARVFDV